MSKRFTKPSSTPVVIDSPTGPKPPRLIVTGVHAHDIQAGMSARVIVEMCSRLNPDDRSRFFGRYSYELDEWFVDGCSGNPIVFRWWPMPAGPGYEQTSSSEEPAMMSP